MDPGSRSLRSPGRDEQSTLVSQQLFQLGAEFGAHILARERISDVRGQETDLRAAVERPALELEAVERQFQRQADHRVGDLDLAAGAAVLRLQNVKNLRLQDVAASDNEVG